MTDAINNPLFNKLRIIKPDPLTERIDDLQRPLLKMAKHFFRIVSPYFWGPKHTDIWPIGRFVAELAGKNILDTRCNDGKWLALPLPVYTSHFINGGDYKRFNRDNIHPILKSHALSGTAVIDVGASCGQEVVTLSKAVGPEGVVYCFEPSYSYEALLRTVSLNQLNNVICIQAACGNRNGYLEGASHGLYFVGTECRYKEDSGTPIIRIDDFLTHIQEQRPLSLIKIDTDGFEFEVIQGAQKTVSHFQTRIVAEFESHFDYSGKRGADVLKRYKELGFRVHKIQTSCQEINENAFESYTSEMLDPENMIAHDIVLVPVSPKTA
ncbi:MAG: FkbM family methyltransferase [Alphaproteobacteria bacterium]|nr:FkbM family methyltransferase [Alphaproteobacteria bacterium]